MNFPKASSRRDNFSMTSEENTKEIWPFFVRSLLLPVHKGVSAPGHLHESLCRAFPKARTHFCLSDRSILKRWTSHPPTVPSLKPWVCPSQALLRSPQCPNQRPHFPGKNCAALGLHACAHRPADPAPSRMHKAPIVRHNAGRPLCLSSVPSTLFPP